MIKARAMLGNRDTVIIGLTPENWVRLHAGQPITFDGAILGLPELRFLVLGGESQQDIAEDLRSIGLPVPKGSVGDPG